MHSLESGGQWCGGRGPGGARADVTRHRPHWEEGPGAVGADGNNNDDSDVDDDDSRAAANDDGDDGPVTDSGSEYGERCSSDGGWLLP